MLTSTLTTLTRKPSWLNRAGRIDRSACLELRASDLWPLVPRFAPARTFPKHSRSNAHDERPRDSWGSENLSSLDASSHLPLTSRARKQAVPLPVPVLGRVGVRSSSSFRSARASFILSAPFLFYDILQRHRPRALIGDFRTRKSNVMKSPYASKPYTPASNPNRGATRTKMLALPADNNKKDSWSQSITIERWQFPRTSTALADHPRTSRTLDSLSRTSALRRLGEGKREGVPTRSRKWKGEGESKPMTFDRSEHARSSRTQHFLLCPRCHRKVMKLFLPLCTPAELADSLVARAYLDSRRSPKSPARNLPGTDLEAALINRYSILFHPRTLLCRHCLGLRYGETKTKSKSRSRPI